MSGYGRPGLFCAVEARIGKVGQFQHLNSSGKPVHLLKAKGHEKIQARVIHLFLNAPVNAHPDHLDAVFIRPDIHKKKIVEKKHQHRCNDQDVPSPGLREMKLRETESPFEAVSK